MYKAYVGYRENGGSAATSWLEDVFEIESSNQYDIQDLGLSLNVTIRDPEDQLLAVYCGPDIQFRLKLI